jgi:DNA processing protein
VVGARAATTYGCDVASSIAYELAERGVVVVSGAAYGIDGAAHRAALAAGGTTVAVLSSGVDRAYPVGHEALLERIAAQGAVVSEAPPGRHPSRARFLTRNRIIAAMSAGVVVVEAALRSGALNTAHWATQLSTHVMAVPGPVTSAMSAGPHRAVIDRGASLVTDAADVLELVSPVGVGTQAMGPPAGRRSRAAGGAACSGRPRSRAAGGRSRAERGRRDRRARTARRRPVGRTGGGRLAAGPAARLTRCLPPGTGWHTVGA